MRGGGDVRRTVGMFGRFTLGQRRSFVYATALLALEAVTAVAVPVLLGLLTDLLVRGEAPTFFRFTPPDGAAIYLIAAGIVVATVVNSSSASLAEISLATAGRTLGFNLRGTLFGHLQRLPLAFHLRRSTGDVLTRITGDVKAMEDFVEDSVSDLVGSVLVLAASLAWLFTASWQVGLLAVAVVPLMSGVSAFFARRIKSAAKQERASEGELASTAQEMLSAISLVQVYGRGDLQEQQFARHSRSARDAVLRTSRLEALFGFTVAVIESVGVAVIVLVGYRLVTGGTLSPGDLITFIGLVQGMFKPIRRIIKQWNKVSAVYASVERVGELLDRQPTVVDRPGAPPAPPVRGEIEYRDVSFAYQSSDDPDQPAGRLALHSVNFRMAAGESVALVGHSGAGKSTIAQLLPRLYDPHAGAVLVDGWDIREVTIDSLRSQMSMVLQETILLRGTVAENIAYGREGATREDVVRAARQANAHDFVTALPEGYDTVLGERAATLSGGQRQRLAIARAFIRDAPILILDEPTTGLDAESAALVAETLQTLARDRSTLIVSHDLNLIRTVDRVLVISAGRILEDGSPEDLLASGGLYAELYARQFGEAVAATAAAASGDAASAQPLAEEPVRALSRLEEELDLDLQGAEPVGQERLDTVLIRGLPQPASPEQFSALTGWVPAVRPSSPGRDDLDPLRSPALTRALPGLAEALDGTAMASRLQRMLDDDWELLACSPGKPLVEPGGGAALQYRLHLSCRATGETVEQVVAGRMFRTPEAADEHMAAVHVLSDRVAGRRDLRAFAAPAVLVRDLGLVLHAVPLDPALPGLVVATDPAQLPGMLGPLVAGALPGLLLQDCRVEVVRYVPGSCVLRYELTWRIEPSRRSLKQVLFGKAYAGEEGRLVGPAVTALRQRQGDGAGPLPFLVPRLQAYLPELRLALLEAVPGSPALPSLIRSRAGAGGTGPPSDAGATPESAVAACARIAAALHRSSAPVGPVRTLAGDLEAARAVVEGLGPMAPSLAATLRRHLAGVGDLAWDMPDPPGVAHGDFEPTQVLFDGPNVALVDFDTVCLAEPSLDLGQFCAHLSVLVRKAGHPAGRDAGSDEDLASVFLRHYLRAGDRPDPDVLVARVAAHRTVALVRLAVRHWCRLKPERVRDTLATLGETRASLP